MHTILAKWCAEFQRQRAFEFRKSPWKHNLSVSILNPEAVIRGYQFHLIQIVHHLIMIRTRKQAVYEEL